MSKSKLVYGATPLTWVLLGLFVLVSGVSLLLSNGLNNETPSMSSTTESQISAPYNAVDANIPSESNTKELEESLPTEETILNDTESALEMIEESF